jgi:DNA-directed RNA polymerase subunit H (RpoH/RPB5)
MSTNDLSILTSKIYRSRKILIEQLADQGYDVSEYENFGMNEVHQMTTNMDNHQLDMLVHKQPKQTASTAAQTNEVTINEVQPTQAAESSSKLYVKYCMKKLSSDVINQLVTELFHADDDPVLDKEDILYIVALEDVKNQQAHAALKFSQGIYVMIQYIERLQVNVLKHQMVPPHSVLTEDETTALVKQLNIESTQLLPPIDRFDPAALAIFIRPGQVCKILRYSRTAIRSPYYRICV